MDDHEKHAYVIYRWQVCILNLHNCQINLKHPQKPQISKGTASQIKDLYGWPVFNSGYTTAIKYHFYALNIFRFYMKLMFL